MCIVFQKGGLFLLGMSAMISLCAAEVIAPPKSGHPSHSKLTYIGLV